MIVYTTAPSSLVIERGVLDALRKLGCYPKEPPLLRPHGHNLYEIEVTVKQVEDGGKK